MSSSNVPKTALEFFDAKASSYEASTGGATRELARYLLSIIPPFDSSSIILDNACGNGIVTQEILLHAQALSKAPPKICSADGAPKMLKNGKECLKGFPGEENVEWHEMPGEKLDFPDEHFTHSITNCGILFFTDAGKGAKEIHRTLRSGGIALVTSWAYLGYVEVIQEAQKAVKPEAEPFKIPIPPHWFQASHLELTLREGGFKDVKVNESTVHYRAKNAEEMADNLLGLIGPMEGWEGDERISLRSQLARIIAERGVKFEGSESEGTDGAVEMVGLPMVALVAVAAK